jgi:hypothetical protein
MFRKTTTILLLAPVACAALFFGNSAKAAYLGDVTSFNVDQNFDSNSRNQMQAILLKVSDKAYFYIDKSWWDAKSTSDRTQISTVLDTIASDFDTKTYPTLTVTLGSEWNPGIDKDPKITILFEEMGNVENGYFRTNDEYSKLQIPNSNEREMIYISLKDIANAANTERTIAHEFVHLITFNQKDRLQNVSDDIWLNEARADYAPTLLGFDDMYEGSGLQKRVNDFLTNPSDDFINWKGTKADYGVTQMFTHYLVDHYGINILSDSLKSKLTGINSINEALQNNKVQESFSQILTDWVIATLINDCSADLRYCYLERQLENIRINPVLNFLPITGSSSLTVSNTTRAWSGNWQKIIGGKGTLNLDFSNASALPFQVPYVVFNKDGNATVQFMTVDQKGSGSVEVGSFGSQYMSIVLMPILKSGTAGISYSYKFTVSISESSGGTRGAFNTNLSLGMRNMDVTRLQQFLKAQGPGIYPSGLVTGYFGNLTKLAVIKFQEKYKSEVLTPAGLSKGTGFVGNLTRQKINSLI